MMLVYVLNSVNSVVSSMFVDSCVDIFCVVVVGLISSVNMSSMLMICVVVVIVSVYIVRNSIDIVCSDMFLVLVSLGCSDVNSNGCVISVSVVRFIVLMFVSIVSVLWLIVSMLLNSSVVICVVNDV